MSRLLVHVEGVTEEVFVNELLCGHLAVHGYERVSARLLGNACQRYRRGGIKAWSNVKKDIVRHLKEDLGCIVTTMVDYYGLPDTGEKAWPGRKEASTLAVNMKASAVEKALLADLSADMGDNFDPSRFVPFVVLHEFEGLLFSDCPAFARGVGQTALEQPFQETRDQFQTPEEINDSPITAQSKRVIELMPSYEKPLFGNLAALEIGLDTIRAACPHFQDWLGRLETRAS